MAAETYQIQGREVRMPVVVRDASTGVATFLVSARAAQRLLPGDAFEVAEVLPGRTPLGIAAIDYRDNDLGDYNEVSITFFVRPRGSARGLPYVGAMRDLMRGELGTYIQRLPVNQEFTCEAGRTIWGFPKTVEEIDIHYETDRVRCRLRMDGQHVLTLSVPRGGDRTMPDRAIRTFTMIEGVPHETPFVQGGHGAGFSIGGATLELGAHAVSEELRSLGLPRRALMCMWTEHMHGTFESPRKL
ncbi:MAG: acetoacetate decarboxylase family protein [Myxococcota bacterium]|nr:acetoacetate decarboxylase family protein [Myxococcota bacterium]